MPPGHYMEVTIMRNFKSILLDAVLIAVGAALLIGVCLGMSALCNTIADAASSALNAALFGI